MNLLKQFTWLIVMMTLALSSNAQEKTQPDSVMKFSLKEAQNYAVQNNKSILNADLDVEMAKKKVWETTAMGLPTVTAKGAYQYTPKLSPIIDALFAPNPWNVNVDKALDSITGNHHSKFGKYGQGGGPNLNEMKWSMTGDLTVSQLIFSGSYLVGLQSAKVYKSLSELSKNKSIQDVLESVSNTYFNILIANENMNILDSTYNNMEKMLSDMEKMNAQGFTEETDVDQMRITLANVKSSLDLIRRQKDLAEKLLKIQLGIKIEQPLQLTETLDQLLSSQTYEQLVLTDFVVDQNINYQMVDAQVKVSSLLLKLRKSETLPEIAAFYQYEKQFNTNAITLTPPHVLGVNITIPIFSSGARWSKIKQAKLDLQKSINNRDVAADNIKVQFYQSKSSLLSAKDKYESDKQNLELSRKIYNRSLVKYQQGIISSIDLTQVQNQFLTSQSTYYQSIQNLIAEKDKLEKLLTKNE